MIDFAAYTIMSGCAIFAVLLVLWVLWPLRGKSCAKPRFTGSHGFPPPGGVMIGQHHSLSVSLTVGFATREESDRFFNELVESANQGKVTVYMGVEKVKATRCS